MSLFYLGRLISVSAQPKLQTSGILFFRCDISVICPVIVLKLAVAAFTSLPFQILWRNWLNFFRSFQNRFGLWPQNDWKNKPSWDLVQNDQSPFQENLACLCWFLRVTLIMHKVHHSYAGQADYVDTTIGQLTKVRILCRILKNLAMNYEKSPQQM